MVKNHTPPMTRDPEFVAMLLRDNTRMRHVGCKLAQAALHVITEHDGIHRLALAVSEWSKAVADEGDRSENNTPVPPFTDDCH